VLIILHGSIQGSNPEFILPKSRSIQLLRTQNLLTFHGVKVTERLPLNLNTLSSFSLWDKLKINLFIYLDLTQWILEWGKWYKKDHQDNHYAQSKKGSKLVHDVLIINFLSNKCLTHRQNVPHYFIHESRYLCDSMMAHWFDSIMECSIDLWAT
jgi:hypothetical protein